MAEFSGRVVSAQFIDAEYTIIKVLYDDNGMLNVYNLDVNPDHPDYQDLLAEGWDHERILEETAEAKRAQAAAWNTEVNTAAKEIAMQMIGTTVLKQEYLKIQEQIDERTNELNRKEEKIAGLGSQEFDAVQRSKNTIFQFVWDADDNKDELFKFKLWALELDFVKTADKSVKSSLRKTKSIIDGLVILKSIK